MPRRLSFLVAGVALCAALLIAGWLYHKSEQTRTNTPVAQVPTIWPGEKPGDSVDPAAAVATILELREQFGSVLSNSELDLPASNGAEVGQADDQDAFGDFLRVAAGVVSPEVADDDVQPSSATLRTSQGELLESINKTAALLTEHARQANEFGDVARQQRFSGLATLLQAEAEALKHAPEPVR